MIDIILCTASTKKLLDIYHYHRHAINDNKHCFWVIIWLSTSADWQAECFTTTLPTLSNPLHFSRLPVLAVWVSGWLKSNSIHLHPVALLCSSAPQKQHSCTNLCSWWLHKELGHSNSTLQYTRHFTHRTAPPKNVRRISCATDAAMFSPLVDIVALSFSPLLFLYHSRSQVILKHRFQKKIVIGQSSGTGLTSCKGYRVGVDWIRLRGLCL